MVFFTLSTDGDPRELSTMDLDREFAWMECDRTLLPRLDAMSRWARDAKPGQTFWQGRILITAHERKS